MESKSDTPVQEELIEYLIDMGSWSVFAKSNDDAYAKAKAIIDASLKPDCEFDPEISGVEKA